MSELVHLDVEAGRATITLDSPANRNALSAQLSRELREHLDSALADDAVPVVVLTHAGGVFCSGMDLRESRGAGAGEQGVQEFPGILQTLWHSAKPVIARVAGPARAGGVGLVAACDIAIGARAGGNTSVSPAAEGGDNGADEPATVTLLVNQKTRIVLAEPKGTFRIPYQGAVLQVSAEAQDPAGNLSPVLVG